MKKGYRENESMEKVHKRGSKSPVKRGYKKMIEKMEERKEAK